MTASYHCATATSGVPVSYSHRKKRTKADWAGVSIGDAFKPYLDHHHRLTAQRHFYRLVRKVQNQVAALVTGQSSRQMPQVAPQIGPCYTTYPSRLAAYAAIGLTGYLEFQALAGGRTPILAGTNLEYWENPAAHDRVKVDPYMYKGMVHMVMEIVQTRLTLEDLYRRGGQPPVEIYRLFTCSEQSLRFDTLNEILQTVVLFGDVIPPFEAERIHPVTSAILRDLSKISNVYLSRLPEARLEDALVLGINWVRTISRALIQYMPIPSPGNTAATGTEFDTAGQALAENQSGRMGAPRPAALPGGEMAPLDGPNPPTLRGFNHAGDFAARTLRLAPGEPTQPMEKIRSRRK
jgi:hypothetical protein